MKKLLTLALCLGLANAAGAQILSEDFDGGTWPPAGWTVVNNSTPTVYSAWTLEWNLDTYWVDNYGSVRPNYVPGGSGSCAAIDSDAVYDSASGGHACTMDSELWTPPFDLPATPKNLVFGNYFYDYSAQGTVDISTDGGLTWATLATYSSSPVSGAAMVDLSAYAGTTGVIVRFHYQDFGWWAYYWQVDNVSVGDPPPPPPPPCGSLWGEGFDGGTWPPAGWSVIDNTTGGQTWNISSAPPFTQGNIVPAPTSGTYNMGDAAMLDSDKYGIGGVQNSELWTLPFDVPATGLCLHWLENRNWISSSDTMEVDISTDSGLTWTNLAVYTSDNIGDNWVDLTAFAGTTGVLVRFHYASSWGWWWCIDEIHLADLPASASAVSRAGGNNPTVFTVSGPPVMGQTMTATVNAGAAGHGYAQLFGYCTPLTLTIGFQKTILVNIADPNGELLGLGAMPGPVASYAIPVPSDCAFAGFALSTQAAIFTLSAPPIMWALTNAQDMVVGN